MPWHPIHRSAWKGNSRKFGCTILHKTTQYPGPMAVGRPYPRSRRSVLSEVGLPIYGVLGSSVLPWCSVVLSAMAHIHSPNTGVCCLRYVTGRGSVTFLPSPLYRERRSLYETHHIVVDHHGPNPVGGKRGGSGGGDRLRRSAKRGRWAGRVHPEGHKRCPSGRHYRREGSSS